MVEIKKTASMSRIWGVPLQRIILLLTPLTPIETAMILFTTHDLSW